MGTGHTQGLAVNPAFCDVERDLTASSVCSLTSLGVRPCNPGRLPFLEFRQLRWRRALRIIIVYVTALFEANCVLRARIPRKRCFTLNTEEGSLQLREVAEVELEYIAESVIRLWGLLVRQVRSTWPSVSLSETMERSEFYLFTGGFYDPTTLLLTSGANIIVQIFVVTIDHRRILIPSREVVVFFCTGIFAHYMCVGCGYIMDVMSGNAGHQFQFLDGLHITKVYTFLKIAN